MFLRFFNFMIRHNPNALYFLHLSLKLKFHERFDKTDEKMKTITNLNLYEKVNWSKDHSLVLQKIKDPSNSLLVICFKAFFCSNNLQEQEYVNLFSTKVLLKLLSYHLDSEKNTFSQRLKNTEEVR